MKLLEISKYINSIKKTQEIKKILSENSSCFMKPLDSINIKKIKKKNKIIKKFNCFLSINLSNLKFI